MTEREAALMENAAQGLAQKCTRDAFLGGRLEILQPKSGYRAGLDAVLLAAAIPFDHTDDPKVLDCGSGVGVVGLCAAVRWPKCQAVLVEREAEFVELAQRNILLNHLDDRVRVIAGDLRVSPSKCADIDLIENSFSHVVANPPFFQTGHGTSSPSRLKAVGHEMSEQDLDLWLRFMVRMARPGGRLVMIHRADMLPALLNGLQGRFGDVQVVPLYPRQGEPANRVILSANKGSRAGLTILPGFTLHEADNGYRAAAEAALKQGAALDFF